MAVEYLGLSEINGPLVVLEGVQGAAYDEIVEMTVGGTTKKIGRIIEIYGDKAIIQVFEGTDGMALRNTHTRLTGHPMEIGKHYSIRTLKLCKDLGACIEKLCLPRQQIALFQSVDHAFTKFLLYRLAFFL